MTKEEQLLEEIKEKYATHFKEEEKMIEDKKITNEMESAKFSEKFHKELSEYIKKRKEELGISTQK